PFEIPELRESEADWRRLSPCAALDSFYQPARAFHRRLARVRRDPVRERQRGHGRQRLARERGFFHRGRAFARRAPAPVGFLRGEEQAGGVFDEQTGGRACEVGEGEQDAGGAVNEVRFVAGVLVAEPERTPAAIGGLG